MTIQQAIKELKKLPPDGILCVSSQGHGGSVPLQGFKLVERAALEDGTPWIDVIYCDDHERQQYGLKPQ